MEFSVCCIAFVTLFMGIFETGRALMVQHQLTNAARIGCRAGVIEGRSTSDIKNAVAANLATQGISGDNVNVQVNDGSADASTANAGDEITVQVSVPVSSITWVPITRYLINNLTGTYTLRRE